MKEGRVLRRKVLLIGLTLTFAACRPATEKIVSTPDGPRPTSEEIDRDPWALLPPGAIAWGRSDDSLFDSAFEEKLEELVQNNVPLSEGVELDLKRDVELMVGGLYATVGSDFVAIVQGKFDAAAIWEKTQEDPVTRSGKPIVIAEFAGAHMYVVDQVGLSVLTNRTMVLGTQLGVRRVLETIEERRMGRNVPEWFEALLADRSSSFQIGLDLDAQPVPAVFRTDWEYLNHLRAARIVGNFESPGLNFAGTLSFSEPGAAEQAALTVSGMSDKWEMYEGLLRSFGIRRPIRKLEAARTGKDVQVVAQLFAEGVVEMLDKSKEIFGEVDLAKWFPN